MSKGCKKKQNKKKNYCGEKSDESAYELKM